MPRNITNYYNIINIYLIIFNKIPKQTVEKAGGFEYNCAFQKIRKLTPFGWRMIKRILLFAAKLGL